MTVTSKHPLVVYECEACSAKPGAATLCATCLRNRAKAGSAWRGPAAPDAPKPAPAKLPGVTVKATTWDGPRWGQPIDACELAGRADHPNSGDCDTWTARDSSDTFILASGMCTWHETVAARRGQQWCAHVIRLIDARNKATMPDDTGPRWGKPPVECRWLGRVGIFDVWIDAAGACIYATHYGAPSLAYPRASLEVLASGGSSNSPWSATLALLDAATAKPEPKAERVVVGYRVRDSEGDFCRDAEGCSSGWTWVSGRTKPLNRVDALDLLRRCRAQFPRFTFRLIRVTRAAKVKGAADV